MAKCSFCGGKIPEGRGKMFVKITGHILNFCNSKCQRNWKLGRDGSKTKWTEASRKDRVPAEKPAEKKAEKPAEKPKETKPEEKPAEKK